MNPYNLVTDGGFEHPAQNAWSMSYNDENDGYQEGTAYGRSAKLKGDETSNKRWKQKIQIGREAKNLHFSVSGMAKANSVSLGEESRQFGLAVRTYFTDGTEEDTPISFNEDAGGIWQYTSGLVGYKEENANKTVDYIYIFCIYYKNANTAYFDQIQVNLDETGTDYTYDEDGNLITAKDNAGRKQTFNYNNASELAKVTTEDNKEYTFAYDSNNEHRLKSAVSNSSDIRFSFTYDSFGNLATTKTTAVNESGSAVGKFIANKTNYSSDGAYQTRQGDDLDQKDTTAYNENTGTVSSYTDRKNHTTSYTYNSSNDLLTSVTGPDEESVTYTYNTKHYLNGITSPSQVQYGFSYDAFGNISSVRVGERTLVSHQYATGNGLLQSSTYGNGDSVSYQYDDLDRVTTQEENGTIFYSWTYNAEGQIGKHKDLVSEKEYQYSYDTIGRLLRTDISDGSWFKSKYNKVNQSTSFQYRFSGKTKTMHYRYSDRDNLPQSVTFNSSKIVTNRYDDLARMTGKTYSTDGQNVQVTYDYLDFPGTTDRTTGIINHVGYMVNGETSLPDLFYVYDKNGNITEIYEDTSADENALLERYTYDNKDQLTRHDSRSLGKTYTYAYDSGGNITEVCEYAYTTESSPINPVERKEYVYGDDGWKDLLTTFDGYEITYDAIGNMTSYQGSNFTWNGRRLMGISNGDDDYSYTYDANGIRTSKTVNGVTTEYFLNGDQILAEKTGDDILWYFYDIEGQRVGLGKNNTTYYYLYDLTGNVTALVNSTTGDVAATYEYDAWGNCIVHNTSNETIGTENPFRYKGYYYNQETGYYYLNSRYYSPEVGKFVNADSQINECDEFLGFNLFLYCNNNPILFSDSTGHLPFCALTAVIGAGIGAIIGGITAAKSGNSVWKGAVKGAVVGGLIGLGAGAGAGAMLVGNVGASTSAVIAGGKLCASYVSSGGVSSGVTYVSNNISSYGQPASTMQQVSQRGKMGEAIAGITKNKEHIPSMTGTADYRIPDGLLDGVLSEVKNYTGTLYYTNQLRDFVMYVQNTPGMKMHLYTNAKLSGPLQELVNNGTIQLFPLK